MPPITDDIEQDQSRRYFDAMQRGETGATLARSAGLPVPVGYSPPIITPTPAPVENVRWDATAANSTVITPNDEMEALYSAMGRRAMQLPIAEAQKAIAAAQQFQAMRGYQNELEKGTAPDQAFIKWAPVMLGGRMTGAGSMLGAMKPAPNYQFVPGSGGSPATYQSPGQRPVIIPQTALPTPEGEPEFIKEEIIPGVFAVGRPGGKGTQIIKQNGETLTKAERLKLLATVGTLEKNLAIMNEGSPSYRSLSEIVNAIKSETMKSNIEAPQSGTNAPGGAVSTPSKKRFTWSREGGLKPVTK